MFKRLFRNMLLVNVFTISMFLFILFGILYYSTYSEIQRRIDQELEMVLRDQFDPFPDDPRDDTINLNHVISFTITTDYNGDVVSTDTMFVIDQTMMDELFEEATSESGKITVDGYTWAYSTKDLTTGTQYGFVEVSNEQTLLNAMLLRFTIIFVISIALTTLIASFLTKRAIKPVKISFDKQRQFVSDASHELKTPLTIMNTNIDILLEQDNKIEDAKWLEYIKTEVTRMSKLTHDLLYLANASELGETKIEQSDIPVSDVAESIVLSMEALAYEKQLNLEYKISPNLHARFQSTLFQQVLMILLDNAIKYTNKKGTITVTVEPFKTHHIDISVRNTGDGIEESELNHIFDRFYKIDKARVHESNSFGLGLAIAKQICDNNHAKLTVESVVGEFTMFTIRLKQY